MISTVASHITGFIPYNLFEKQPWEKKRRFLYKKRKAKYQSSKARKKTSRKLEALTYYRNRFVENYLHNTNSLVVESLTTNNIGTVVIGKNDN
ncbi:transposase [Trichodesmium erythraeum]|uniref:transposase n=1 Tax=Trichodesmium erythraeum TaxID=1206 RepID=UPI0008FF812E|nr:transposase [Trichodesmium erythraeum GBRTRLIN201]